MRAARSFALAGVVVLSALAFAGARSAASPTCTITWDGGAGTTAWATATNWDLDRLPGAADHVCIPAVPAAVVYLTGTTSILSLQAQGAVSLTGGTLALTDTSNASNVATFSQTGGTLGGAAAVNVGGVYTWTGGAMDGSGTTNVIAGATLAQDGFTTLSNGRVLEIAGTYDFKSDRAVGTLGVPAPSIHNVGTIRKSGGSLTATIGVALDNDGSVQSSSGVLDLRAGTGTATGSFGAAAAAGTVRLAAGTYTLAGATLLGNAAIAGATVTVPAGTGVVASGPNAMSAGTVNGTGSFTIASGTFTWTGGTMADAGTTTVAAGATLAHDGFVSLSNGRMLENAGTYDFISDRPLDPAGSPAPSFHNTGTIRKSGGTVTATINTALDNDGSVRSDTGKLTLRAGTGTSTGSFGAPAAAGTVEFGGGTHTLAGASLLGNVTIAAGTVNVPAGASLAASGANAMSGGTLGGTGSFTIGSGTFTWTGGTMTDPGTTTVAAGATLAQDGPTTFVAGRLLENAGTYDFKSDRSVADSSAVAPLIHNTGTIRKTGGTGEAIINPAVANDGTITSTSGKLTLRKGADVAQPGTFAGSSDLDHVVLGGGTFRLTAATTFQGTVEVGGASVQVASGTTLAVPGRLLLTNGELRGPGDVDVAGTLVWKGGTQFGPGTTVVRAGARMEVDPQFCSVNLRDGRRLLNNGAIALLHHTSINATGAPKSVIDNAGRIDLDDGAATSCGLVPSTLGGTLLVNNAAGATISKLGSTVAATADTRIDGLDNDGLVEAQAGALSLTSTSAVTQGGTFSSTGAGASVAFTSGTFVMGPGARLVGQSKVGGAELDVADRATLRVAPGDSLSVTGGTVAGAGTLMIGGTFAWVGGTQQGSGATVVETGATATFDGRMLLEGGRTFVNHGSIAWRSGDFFVGEGASFVNAGTLEMQGASNLIGEAFGLTSGSLFHNAGLFRKTAATTGTIQIPVDNDGTIEVDGGRLSIQGRLLNYGLPGKTLTAGGYVVRGATLELPGAVASNASTLVLDGAGANLVFVDPIVRTDRDALDALAADAGAGELTLDNGRAVTTPGPLRNAGILRLGTSSALTTTGAYRQTGGTTVLGSAASRLTATGAAVQVVSGRFGGIGSAGPELAATGGEIQPGLADVGILHADAYTAGASSALRMQIAGGTPGAGYDQFAVVGAAALGGTLAIETAPDFHPAVGSTFQLLMFASRTGTFSSVTGLAPGGGLAYDLVYNATNVTLVVTAAGPRPVPDAPPADELPAPGEPAPSASNVVTADGGTASPYDDAVRRAARVASRPWIQCCSSGRTARRSSMRSTSSRASCRSSSVRISRLCAPATGRS